MKESISRRQLVAAAYVAVLSPMIRRLPRVCAQAAGRTAWISVPLTLLPLAAVFFGLWLFYRRRERPIGFAGILTDIWGRAAGKCITALYALWFAFYAGFLLRSGAQRFITTVYHDTGIWIFVAVTALMCLPAVLGSVRATVRAAMIIRPLMTALFVLVCVQTFRELDLSMLLPVHVSDLPANGIAVLETVNVISAAGFLAFLGGSVEGRFSPRDFIGWTVTLLVIIELMTVCCLALFGPSLTANMSFPFFMLVRDVDVLGSIERIEPLVIAVWVLSDFVMISLLLRVSAENFRFALGFSAAASAETAKAHDLRQGRWLLVGCTLAAAAAALTMANDKSAFDLLSETLVPRLNMGFSLGIPALSLLIGALRRKL